MNRFLIALLASLLFSSCSLENEQAPFTFKKNAQGVEILENDKPVFFYQKTPKSIAGEYISNNYLHPLYNLEGDTLTEEFPEDHPYHRGVYWAWHQIYINGKSVGDGWIMENIQQEVVDVKTSKSESSARLALKVLWKSPLFQNSRPFVMEETTITVLPENNGMRKIDFAIALQAYVPNVEIGGSADIKGYGGFCLRLKLPEDLTFTSSTGPVTPETEQVKAGAWMDFSSTHFSSKEKKGGIALLCHPQTPNYPAPWILRSKTSMQNVVFPGENRISLPANKKVVLYYRLIIHNEDAGSIDFNKLQSEYEATKQL